MTFPRPPTLRALTRELKEMHEAFAHPCAGGEFVELRLAALGRRRRWYVATPLETAYWDDAGIWSEKCFGREYVPGDGLPFDAVAAARRLLAAVRDATAGSKE